MRTPPATEATAPLGGCTITVIELTSKLLLSVVISGTKFFVAVPPMPVPSGSVEMVGSPPDVVTVKSPELVTVLLATVTVIFPVVAPVETVTVMVVAVLAVTTAEVPLN